MITPMPIHLDNSQQELFVGPIVPLETDLRLVLQNNGNNELPYTETIIIISPSKS
jgi:hypothetical protein